MRILTVLAMCLACLSSPLLAQPQTKAQAQPPAQPQLKEADVDQFCKAFPALQQDLGALGVRMDQTNAGVSLPQAMMASQSVLDILKKNGMDESFGQKMSVIVQGYSALICQDAIKELEAELQKALKELDDTPNLSPEFKTQMKQQYDLAGKGIKDNEAQLRATVHPSDLALIQKKKAEIQKVLETIGGKNAPSSPAQER